MESRKKLIGVIGGSTCTDEIAELAESIGREIAKNGGILICGGKGGVMEASCKGAKEAGGQTVGILPDDITDEGNRYIDIAIATGMGIARNVIIVRSADVIIAINGRYGTLSEISYALQLNVPIVSIRSWDDLIDPKIVKARDAKEAVKKAFQLI